MFKTSETETQSEKQRIINGFFFPALFVVVLWLIKLVEITFEMRFIGFGLYPRTLSGLGGVFFAPLIHGSIYHLISNSVPLLFLGTIIFYFYRGIAFKVFFWVYLMTGVWVWAAGRDAYHIGASGLIYGFVCFLFFSGLFRKDRRMLALSFLVTFIYGSLVWGIFPVSKGVSWESHLLGSLAGFITAFYFRYEGPRPQQYFEDEPDESDDSNPFTVYNETLPSNEVKIRYLYKPEEQKQIEK